jgi:hypothetical protein
MILTKEFKKRWSDMQATKSNFIIEEIDCDEIFKNKEI